MNKHESWQHYSQRRPSSSTPEDDFDAGWNMEKEQGHCKDCRYWEHHQDTLGKDWHECNIDWVDLGNPVGEAEAAVYATANDEYGLLAGLMTGPMFGCVGFKLRTPDDEIAGELK